MYANQDLGEVQYDLDNGGVLKYLESSPTYSMLGQSEARSKKRIAVLSNLITRNRSFQHTICDYMKIGEDLYCKVHESPRLPRVVLTPNLQHGRQELPNTEARKSSNHQSEHSVQYREICRSLFDNTRRKHLEESRRGKQRETCRGNVDYRISRYTSRNRPESRLESQGNRRTTDSTVWELHELGNR